MTDATYKVSLAAAPIAARTRRPPSRTTGSTLTDDYAWLRDPGYPEVTDKDVLAHLEAENAWFEAPHEAAPGH